MENALSDPGDNLSARGDSRAQARSSVAAPPPTSASSQAQQSTSVVVKGATIDVASMVAVSPSGAAVSTAETNNNLKIFKSEYDMKPAATSAAESTKTQNNGVSEHHHDHTTCKMSMVSADTLAAASASADSETKLTDLSTTCHQLAECSLSAGDSNETTQATVDSTISTATTVSGSDQSHSDSEQQQQQQNQSQQQVPSATSKLPPTIANNRSILILREIQPDTPESLVREIFTSENCPSRPVHCEYALHNSWYVTFKDDEEARLALAYIRKHIVKWQGKSIMARYKPKPAVPSANNEPPAPTHHPHPQHHLDQHQIVPNMVMQQEHQQNYQYQNGALDTAAAPAGQIPSPGFLGVPSASAAVAATSIDGDHEHHVQPPVVISPVAQIMNHTGGAPPLSSHSPGLMPAYGPQHPTYHNQHHPDGMLNHDQAHHQLAQMMSPLQHPQMASYAPYYNQHGQLVHAPWDLSSVFIYNGLSPYNKTSVSGVSFVGGPTYHQQLAPPQSSSSQQHQAHLNHHYPAQHHQRHHQGNNNYNSNHHHTNHHQRMNQQHSQSHHSHHSSNHQGNINGGGGGGGGSTHQQVFANNHHQGSKSSRKNKQSNNK